MVGDAALVIDALIAEISKQKGPGGGNALASLKEEVAAGKKAWLDEWAKFLNSDETPLNQYRVIRDMMRTLPPRQRHHHPRFREVRASR